MTEYKRIGVLYNFTLCPEQKATLTVLMAKKDVPVTLFGILNFKQDYDLISTKTIENDLSYDEIMSSEDLDYLLFANVTPWLAFKDVDAKYKVVL